MTNRHRQEFAPTTSIPTFPHFLRVPDYRCSHECILCPSCERLINIIFRAYRKLSVPPPCLLSLSPLGNPTVPLFLDVVLERQDSNTVFIRQTLDETRTLGFEMQLCLWGIFGLSNA
ncbi:hypothetical protein GOODEAATRI_005605 [Goodea atripinnis]|uniref:Uncharacterized protein n=1 Tax=Goodea atripinnis TaxID=208336 RepID=A0ABV0NHR6_9TELE